MSPDIENARDDLAYMRALVKGGDDLQASAGEAFIWAGLLYGFQCLVHWGQAIGAIHLTDAQGLVFAAGVTAVFIAALFWVGFKHRKTRPTGAAARALSAAFSAVGAANLVMVFVFAYTAVNQHNFLIWLLYPAMVGVIQGAAWLIAFMIRRRAWLLAVGLGWFATAVVMTITIGTSESVLIMAAACFLLLALPGWAMMRSVH